MIPCLSQLTTLRSAFDADLRDYGEVGVDTVEVWLTKLENYLAHHTLDDVKQLADRNGIRFGVASLQGGLLLAQGEARRESFTLFERRLNLCRSLDISTLVLAADFVDEMTELDYDRAVVSLKQVAQRALPSGIRLALEFQGRARFCNNLHTAASLVAHAAEPNVGICLDVFHYYTGPSKSEDFALMDRDNLFHVQLSDLAGVPRELATDSDRVLPGDGDFDLAPIVQYLRDMGYEGCVSVELMNPQIWEVPARQVVEVSITAVRKLLGQVNA